MQAAALVVGFAKWQNAYCQLAEQRSADMATEAVEEARAAKQVLPPDDTVAAANAGARKRLELAFKLLGNPGGHEPLTPLEAHVLIREGLPARSLLKVLNEAVNVASSDMLFVLDISQRTRDRLKRTPKKRLALEQSDRLWRYAELLAAAIEVFGSREAAEDWLTKPATALDRRVPLELLSTAPGAQLVEDLLTRLRYNVYT